MMNSMKKKITVLALLVSSFNISLKAGTTDLNIMLPDYNKYRMMHCKFRSTSTSSHNSPSVCDDRASLNLTSNNHVILNVDPKKDKKSRYYVEKNTGEAGWVPLAKNGSLLGQGQNKEVSYFTAKDFHGYAG